MPFDVFHKACLFLTVSTKDHFASVHYSIYTREIRKMPRQSDSKKWPEEDNLPKL
jgi:hypothetical protein